MIGFMKIKRKEKTMTKKIDSKGRITIPKKIRKQLKLKPNQTLKIRNEKNSIILTK